MTIPSIPSLPSGAVPIRLLDVDELGIHASGATGIVLNFVSAVLNADETVAVEGGATTWDAIDGNGVVQASGTCSATATSITVPGPLPTGHYTLMTQGSNGVSVGNFVIDVPGRQLPVPAASYSSLSAYPYGAFSAWVGNSADRYLYGYVVTNIGQPGSNTAAQIIANRAVDPYFTGAQDSARPHRMWVTAFNQADYPTQMPAAADWGALASALVTAGYSGVDYELPTNEPENGGWSVAEIITYWNAAAAAILAEDSTAKLWGWDSGGIFNNTPPSGITTFLAGITHPLTGFTNHLENSHQNTSNTVLLRQEFGTIIGALPNGTQFRWTETGINGAVYYVVQGRREARQRTVLNFVLESLGAPKEGNFSFPTFDLQGSGLSMYEVDAATIAQTGNMRAGAMAEHVQSEALYGCPATPTSLTFGISGSMADSLFMGTHYTSAARDVVVLATNCLAADTVTLNVSNTTGVTAWDGWGNTRPVSISGSHVTVAVDDLLTYVFLPSGTTVSVVDTGSGAIALSSRTVIGQLSGGDYQANNGLVGGPSVPYTAGSTGQQSFSYNVSGHAVGGFAVMSPGEAWQTVGCAFTDVLVELDGTTVYHWTDATAVSYAIPSGSEGNSSDPATRTAYWQAPFAAVYTFPTALTGTTLIVKITPAYGGQPDPAASVDTTPSNLVTPAYNENDPQTLQLANLQIFQAAASPPPSTPQMPSLYALLG
jgi:hypothetical protein